jgi:hypothetical protein
MGRVKQVNAMMECHDLQIEHTFGRFTNYACACMYVVSEASSSGLAHRSASCLAAA